MRRRWTLLAIAAVPRIYWIDQCALPSRRWRMRVRGRGDPRRSQGRSAHVAAEYVPVGMDEDAALALVKKAGFRLTDAVAEREIAPDTGQGGGGASPPALDGVDTNVRAGLSSDRKPP